MKLLTNFDNIDFERYEYCVNTFPKSEEYGLYLRNDAYYGVNNNILLKEHSSLWSTSPGNNKSEFWRYFENVEKNWDDIKLRINREKRLNRILGE